MKTLEIQKTKNESETLDSNQAIDLAIEQFKIENNIPIAGWGKCNSCDSCRGFKKSFMDAKICKVCGHHFDVHR